MSAQHLASALPAPAGWLEPPANDAYQGLAGRLVEAIAPHTEADPVAILAQLLVAAGAVIGRGAYFSVEATRHHPNQFVVLVGDSAKARKGSSWSQVERLMQAVDESFRSRVSAGLSSGEGLVWALRDARGLDAGAPDPRLLVVEPEFASVLKACSREQNTLSPVLRSAWDGRPLGILTRSAPVSATDAHLCVVGHITTAELRHCATSLEVANGLLNRFCFIACRRAQLLPEGGNPDPLGGTGLLEALIENLTRAKTRGQVNFAETARQRWHQVYEELAQPGEGITGALVARAEAHVVRLALIYSLIDGASAISSDHLSGALAMFDYATRSASYAFDDVTGDPVAEQICTALLSAPEGLTRTEVRDLFSRNRSPVVIDRALERLVEAGKARCERVMTGGRPARLWRAGALTKAS